MYGIILAATLTSAAPGCYASCATSTPRICCPVPCGCCGVVRFFFTTTPPLSEPEMQIWQRYLNALDDNDRMAVKEWWRMADFDGRKKMIAQAAAMHPANPQPKAPQPEGMVRRPERSGATPVVNKMSTVSR